MNAALEIAPDTSLRAYHAGGINGAWDAGREAIFTIGRKLIDAKLALAHGEFTAMIEKDLRFGPEHARRFMRIASDPRLTNRASTPVLPESVMAMDQLRRLNDIQFEAAIASGVIHENMTVPDATRYVREMATAHVHRPIALQTPAPCRPDGPGATSYGELIWLLVAYRGVRQLPQSAVDHIVGWSEGQTGKYEIPHTDDGRTLTFKALFELCAAYRIGVQFVPLDAA